MAALAPFHNPMGYFTYYMFHTKCSIQGIISYIVCFIRMFCFISKAKSGYSTETPTFVSGERLPSPQHAVRPSRSSLFLAGVIFLTEQVILVGGCKIYRTFFKSFEHLLDRKQTFSGIISWSTVTLMVTSCYVKNIFNLSTLWKAVKNSPILNWHWHNAV